MSLILFSACSYFCSFFYSFYCFHLGFHCCFIVVIMAFIIGYHLPMVYFIIVIEAFIDFIVDLPFIVAVIVEVHQCFTSFKGVGDFCLVGFSLIFGDLLLPHHHLHHRHRRCHQQGDHRHHPHHRSHPLHRNLPHHQSLQMLALPWFMGQLVWLIIVVVALLIVEQLVIALLVIIGSWQLGLEL